MALYVVAAAATITGLLVLTSVHTMLDPVQVEEFGRAITAAGLAAVLAGMFSYTFVQQFNRLTRSDLCRALTGDELSSASWGALGLLGMAIGGSIALFHALAVALLPLLPAFLIF